MLLPTLCTYNSDIFFSDVVYFQKRNLKTDLTGVVSLCPFNAKHPFKFDAIFPRLF